MRWGFLGVALASGCAIKVNTDVSPTLQGHEPLGDLLAAPWLAPGGAPPSAPHAPGGPVVVEGFRAAYEEPLGLWLGGAGDGRALSAEVEGDLLLPEEPGSETSRPEILLPSLIAAGLGERARVRAADDLSAWPSGARTLRGWVRELEVYRVDETLVARVTCLVVVLDDRGDELARGTFTATGRASVASGGSPLDLAAVLAPLLELEAREIFADPGLARALGEVG